MLSARCYTCHVLWWKLALQQRSLHRLHRPKIVSAPVCIESGAPLGGGNPIRKCKAKRARRLQRLESMQRHDHGCRTAPILCKCQVIRYRNLLPAVLKMVARCCDALTSTAALQGGREVHHGENAAGGLRQGPRVTPASGCVGVHARPPVHQGAAGSAPGPPPAAACTPAAGAAAAGGVSGAASGGALFIDTRRVLYEPHEAHFCPSMWNLHSASTPPRLRRASTPPCACCACLPAWHGTTFCTERPLVPPGTSGPTLDWPFWLEVGKTPLLRT